MYYPFARTNHIERNFTKNTNQRPVYAVVLHIADGLGSPYEHFNRRPTSLSPGTSAHFWVSKEGVVHQFRPTRDICWANGILDHPDHSSPLVFLMHSAGINPNDYTIAVEHEGKAGEELTMPQQASSIALVRWIGFAYNIPLNQNTVLGHNQFDSVNRKFCPGFDLTPWRMGGALGMGIQDLFHSLWPVTEAIAANAVDLQRQIGAFKEKYLR